MRQDFYYASKGIGLIRGCRWAPAGEVKAVVQIVHGVAEHAQRYDEFASFLNEQGILVVAEDHMGHGKSVENGGSVGYFDGGWHAAVADTYQLLRDTRALHPEVPYVLFGHSMGSFMARTILCDYPDSGIAAAIICGTGWTPEPVLKAGIGLSRLVCKFGDERKPGSMLNKMIFGGYNKRIEHLRTSSDWLTRDQEKVDAYIADPMCGFTASSGLLRDMMHGISYIQTQDNLDRMDKRLPVLFVAGSDDPVGNYGEGVKTTVKAFENSGMEHVDLKLYPLCRHEIHNEINRQEIYQDLGGWIKENAL